LIVVFYGLVTLFTAPSILAGTQRHLVIYGGFSKTDLSEIARNVDTLIVGTYRVADLKELKSYNPNLVLLRYHHALGARPNTPDWSEISADEAFFVHDAATGRRLVERKYGWRLLNITTPQWRRWVCTRILRDTEAIFDGVFIDDFWVRYVDKFIAEGLGTAARPAENVIDAWQTHMAELLKQLRAEYPKKIFINGAYPEYIELVDGCMAEGFVHGSQESDTTYPSLSEFYRSLLHIERLKPYGKTVLVQSGTAGDRPDHTEDMYRLCAAGYFLIAGPQTSFGFNPSLTYAFSRFSPYDDYHLELGTPRTEVYIHKQAPEPANLIPNGDFSQGLNDWQIIDGRPAAVKSEGGDGLSIEFQSRSSGSDRIRSAWVQVDGHTRYRIFARCKSQNNRPGSARYKKLGLQGRFYDIHRQKLPGAFDLQFDPGHYDWLPFEITHTSPAQAAFFRIRLGFIGDGSGKGWVDAVQVTPTPVSGLIWQRDFEKGRVTVNYGLPDNPPPHPPDDGPDTHHTPSLGPNPFDAKIVLFEPAQTSR
jgi:hypothetical protein